MRIVLNIIWLVFAGLWATILWCLAGIVMCILIITIPFGIQAFKMVLKAGTGKEIPDPQSHEGYDWMYILNGKLRLVLGGNDFILKPGEVAEFDTRTPHWFASATSEPVELLTLFGVA